MKRVIYEDSELLTGILGSPDEVGYDISLSKVYDDIRNARFDEDSTVSFGVWERELKKADWTLTEQLCVDAIKTQSKDFQILGWLIEALVVLDGLEGIAHGIKILSEFSKLFWKTGYPRKEDHSSDSEQKLRICEWIFDVTEKRSKFIPLVSQDGNNFIDLYQYEYALELKNIVVRSPSSSAKILDNAKKDGHKSLEEVLSIIQACSQSNSEKILNSMRFIKDEKTVLDKMLSTLTGKNINSFSGLMGNLEKIERVLKSEKKKSKEADIMSPSKVLDTKSRDIIYNSIADLARQLATLERHSPSAFILNLVVSWKDKNLLEIMDDLKSGNSEAHRLLKQLLNI